MSEKKKIRSICVDTLTQIQENSYMTDKKKANHDKWFDYGQEVYGFLVALQELGFECILVLGNPGTGKSTGQRTLEPGTHIWYNADNKNPVWIGGREVFGKKTNPKPNLHVIPKTYQEIINHIKGGIQAGMFEEDRYAFLTGHVETYKQGLDTKARLKTLGQLNNKMQVEGKLETVFYSTVEIEDGERKYLLEAQSDGIHSARSPQGLFEDKIPNDYQFVLDKLINY